MPVRPTGTPGRGASTVLDSTLLVPSRRVTCTLEPGRTKYFHIDVPSHHATSERPSLTLRLNRAGGDPVLMASSGQWPVVDLDAEEDMVRAHHCAFDAFHADAENHVLTIGDCATPRPPHVSVGGSAVLSRSAARASSGGAAADPRSLPLFPRPSCGNSLDSAVRWAIGVHNVSLVKEELCSFTLTATIGTTKPASRASFSPASAGARRASGGPAGLGPRTAASHRGPRPQPPQPPPQPRGGRREDRSPPTRPRPSRGASRTRAASNVPVARVVGRYVAGATR